MLFLGEGIKLRDSGNSIILVVKLFMEENLESVSSQNSSLLLEIWLKLFIHNDKNSRTYFKSFAV